MTIPTKEELQKAWDELRIHHKKYLKKEGVIIPKGEKFDTKNESVWLSVLYLYRHRFVHKDEISKITQHYKPKARQDQQVRHLKRKGWEIGEGSGVHQLDINRVSQDFKTNSKLKNAVLDAQSFEDLKQAYNNCCASCGVKEGKTSPRYGNQTVQLQKGHRDPSKRGNDIRNIIPQCQYCNRAYKNDFTFDEKGRVRAVASVNPVKRANKNVQDKILKWLVDSGNENESD